MNEVEEFTGKTDMISARTFWEIYERDYCFFSEYIVNIKLFSSLILNRFLRQYFSNDWFCFITGFFYNLSTDFSIDC